MSRDEFSFRLFELEGLHHRGCDKQEALGITTLRFGRQFWNRNRDCSYLYRDFSIA